MNLRRVALMAGVMMVTIQSIGVSQVRIAVIPFSEEPGAEGSELGLKLARMISLKLSDVGTYTVVQLGTVESALERFGFGPQQLGDLAVLREVGFSLGASHLVLGAASGAGEELVLTARVLEVGGGTLLAPDTVRGSRGDVISLSDHLFSLLALSLGATGLGLGEVPYVNFEETYTLTPMDMENRQDNHGYVVLHRDPDLGWELGVACRSSRSNTALGRYCPSVIFRISQDLSNRMPTRGVDGMMTIGYTRSTIGSLDHVWSEVRLEGLERTLTFVVEPLNAIISKDFANTNRPDPEVFGARQIEVRVRLTG